MVVEFFAPAAAGVVAILGGVAVLIRAVKARRKNGKVKKIGKAPK